MGTTRRIPVWWVWFPKSIWELGPGKSSACPTRSFFGPVVALGFLAFAAAGCHGTGDVSGKVTFQGKPLVFGTVLFEGSNGALRQGNIEKDGSYVVSGVATGEAKAAVSSRNPKSSDFIPIHREGAPKPPPRPDFPGWFPIPSKYDAPYISGLTYSIKQGENKIDIELQ
jgi:hypothetical protein